MNAPGEDTLAIAKAGTEYSFVFDKAKDAWVCSVHGEVYSVGWVPCWNGCNEGCFDNYEEDPLMFDPGDFSTCSECNGKGGWRVCSECNADNPDVEW
jgi:hypothetical protein